MFGTGVCAHPWRTGRAPHIRPAPIIRNSMDVCVRKHVFRNDPLTHPTNPEVAACRAPVFWLRFVVRTLPRRFQIFSDLISMSGAVGRASTCLCTVGVLGFLEGRSHVTQKFKWSQRESAHASGAIRKPSARTTIVGLDTLNG